MQLKRLKDRRGFGFGFDLSMAAHTPVMEILGMPERGSR